MRRTLGLIVVLCALVAAAARSAELVRLSSTRLQVGFDAATGRWVELTDVATGHNFVAGAVASAPWWSLQLAAGAKEFSVEAKDAGRFECRAPAGSERTLRLAWSEFAGPAPAGLRVEVVISPTDDPAVGRWEIAVAKPRECAVRQVVFPKIASLAEQPREFLAMPTWLGELLANPRQALAGTTRQGTRLAMDYPGRLALQCVAFYAEGGAGLYLAADDAAALRKAFVATADGRGGMALEVAHLPENGALGSERYAPAYGVRLGTFQGDWITAAERYRTWALLQPWALDSRLASGRMPAWVRDTALWVWNRGRSDEVLAPAAAMQRELGLPVSVLWHWWHGCAYDTGFPEYLPPREGAESFSRALAAAHAQQVHAMVYMNQRLWGLTTRSWSEEGAAAFAVRRADGTYREEVYNTFTKQACVSMCMGTAFWRNKYAGLAERAIRELGVDGIYMDQACSSLACYDPKHGHALGGGAYWMDGFRQLSTDIRRRGADVRPIALAGEGTGEAWLPYLDLMLSLEVSRERYHAPTPPWEPIPFFQAVYHRHSIQFGNYSSLTMPPYDELWPAEFAPKEPLRLLDQKYARQFRLEQARAFVWGQQPMIANFRPSLLRERPDEIAYVVRLARLRQATLDYLLHGEFVRPPTMDARRETCDVSRLSIYAGQQGALTSFTKALPQLVAGAWRSPAGKLAVALASIADEPQVLTLGFDAAEHQVPTGSRVVRIDEQGRTPFDAVREDGTLKVTLPPRGACVLEFSRP
ncbi:MAG: hypothetical protein HZA93_21985 [Verrucomicrobia bacterium]|nr:hypothetical protein [Verrucomicrobiota bacterium]